MKHNLKINDLILLTIKRLGINGEGIGYYKRLAVFVEGAIPSEVVEVKITEVKPKYVYGKIVKFKVKSPDRVQPRSQALLNSSHPLQYIKYSKQLELKRESLIEAFERYYNGDLSKVKIHSTFGFDNPWEYQTLATFPTRHDGNKVVVGVYERITNRLIYLDKYHLENKTLQNVLKEILDFLSEAEVNVFHPKHNRGNLRSICLRGFEETNEVQVIFVLLEEEERILNIFKRLVNIPNLKSINYTINNDLTTNEIDNKIINLAGSKQIKSSIGDLRFDILPNMLFELNPKKIVLLREKLIELGRLKKTYRVLALHCGVGLNLFGIANLVAEVRGMDLSSENIEFARGFAQQNNLQNIKFYSGDFQSQINNLKKEGYKPDLLIIEPARSGLEVDLIKFLQKEKIKKLIYISANYSTLAKDLNHLQRLYKLKEIIPLDTKPNTPFLESISLLE